MKNIDPHYPLIPQWAFVVQFRAETEIKHGRVHGRVEHVPSGQAATFASLEELVAFFDRIVCSPRE